MIRISAGSRTTCSFTRLVACAFACTLSCACDDKPKANPVETTAVTATPEAVTPTPPKLRGPPEFNVSANTAQIGGTYLMLETPDGKKKLTEEIAANKDFVSGKAVPVIVDRQSKLSVVAALMRGLEDGGATAVVVSTDSRPEYPKTVSFASKSSGKSAPACSVVAEVLAERKNAVWSLRGGTALKSPKGLAGPDMVITADTLQTVARRCKESDFVFVSAEPGVEWGMVYDLAAASQTLEKAKLGKVVLLDPGPTAGRPVKLD